MKRPLHRAECAGIARGFTLIELLVVVAIAGTIVAALTLAVASAGGERTLGNEAERVRGLLGQACAQAELSGRELGLVVGADGYSFRRLDGSSWAEIAKDETLRARRWPSGLHVELARDGRPLDLAAEGHDTPQVVCFSSGEMTPFTMTLALGEAGVRFQLKGKDDAGVDIARLEARH